MTPAECEPSASTTADRAAARERALQCQTALLELAALEKSEFGTFLRRVLKSDAQLLGVARVSFWRLEHSPAALRCEALYTLDTDAWVSGPRLLERDCPHYMQALREELLLVASDARTDPRTCEFTQSYLDPLGIGAMLDVPVWVRGQLEGVVCHEHLGGTRPWTPKEQEVALSIGHLVSMGLEASARKRAEEALRQSEERFLLLLEQARDYSIVMLDPQGRIRAGTQRIRGYRPEELEGRHLSLFHSAEDIELGRPEAALQQAVEQGRYAGEGWLVRRDGTRFWGSLMLLPLWNEAGGLRGFAGVMRDLTEERLAGERERLLEEARQAVGLRDEFLSIASHELRTPLATLQLTLQGMQQRLQRGGGEGLDDVARRKLESATRQTVRLKRLIDELLEVSRISSGRLQLQHEDVDLVELTRGIIEQLREEAARARASLVLEEHGPVRGQWDVLRLEQVVTNLLTNALKYGEGHPVQVRVEARGELARLTVCDKGMGIAEEDRARIFERFERAVPAHHVAGLGLGLYVTRQIVEAHHGVIRVDSRPGEGSTFSVWLPRTPPEGSRTLPPDIPPPVH